MNGISRFELRVSLFNAIGLAMAIGVPTYLDAWLTTHIWWGSRSYPLGFWVLLLAPLVFITSTVCFRYIRGWRARVWVPSTLVVVAGLVSLLNFRPEFPHVNIIAWVLLFAVASISASWIHYLPVQDTFLQSPKIRFESKVDKIKEMVALWRAFSITFTATYAGLLIPWYMYYLKSTPVLVSDPVEAWVLKLWMCGEVGIFSVWMFLGPILESWSRTATVSDLLLRLPEEPE